MKWMFLLTLVLSKDFGLSNFVHPGVRMHTFCGSPIYAPPEIVMKKDYEGPIVDIWSSGVILFTMVTGHLPWKLKGNRIENLDDMLSGNFSIPSSVKISQGTGQYTSFRISIYSLIQD